jgi:hypothetical protein
MRSIGPARKAALVAQLHVGALDLVSSCWLIPDQEPNEKRDRWKQPMEQSVVVGIITFCLGVIFLKDV